jgi:hypothetical protein
MSYFFSKNFSEINLGNADYWKCDHCGFCSSKTHFDMTDEEWQTLNDTWHATSHSNSSNPYNRNQRYFNQALMLSLMKSHGLISDGGWLDWGAGMGAVSELLENYFGGKLYTYDKYLKCPVNPIDDDKLRPKAFDLVSSMAVFEHVRSHETLDEIESYVNKTGCLATHTLVPEAVPNDPDWMYLLPVHCAFHTNKSMQILMDSWGYTCSVYNEQSKLWVWFKKNQDEIEPKVTELNESMGWEYLHLKKGFVDYWK